MLASLAGVPGTAAQRPAEQRRLSLSGVAAPPAAVAKDQQQPGKPALQQQQQQPGKPAQPQQQQQQPGKPTVAKAPIKAAAAAAGADPLSAAWMTAFKGPPGGSQPVPRSMTAPAQQAAAIAKPGVVAAAGAGTGVLRAPVPRSLSAPEREARQQAAAPPAAAASGAAAVPSAAAEGSQKQAAPPGPKEAAAGSAAAAAGGGKPTSMQRDIAEAMLAEVGAKQKAQKRPAPEALDVMEAAEQRKATRPRTGVKSHAEPGSGGHAGGSKGHNKLAALVRKAQRQGGRL